MAEDAWAETTRLIERKLTQGLNRGEENLLDEIWEGFAAYTNDIWHITPSRMQIELFLGWCKREGIKL